jgi:hypothetical protein
VYLLEPGVKRGQRLGNRRIRSAERLGVRDPVAHERGHVRPRRGLHASGERFDAVLAE